MSCAESYHVMVVIYLRCSCADSTMMIVMAVQCNIVHHVLLFVVHHCCCVMNADHDSNTNCFLHSCLLL
jgi:hypothetical protein